MHGANRLGGNGVANSTVFGAIAGDAMAGVGAGQRGCREPDARRDRRGGRGAASAPFAQSAAGDLEAMRERLYDVMWDDVGIVRDAAGLARSAGATSTSCDRALRRDRRCRTRTARFNLTWHDWLNLEEPDRREPRHRRRGGGARDSRGAHFRADFPECGALEHSAFTSIKDMSVSMKPVTFTRVKPGQTLLRNVA